VIKEPASMAASISCVYDFKLERLPWALALCNVTNNIRSICCPKPATQNLNENSHLETQIKK
jgi:hypothetical protein